MVSKPIGLLALPMSLQVTDKTRGDVQGGTLVQYQGKAKLLELSQASLIEAQLI